MCNTELNVLHNRNELLVPSFSLFSAFDANYSYFGPFAGTGYLTGCFALMVGPQGRAVGVEHIPELVSFSIENIKKSAAALPLKDGSLSVHCCGTVSMISFDIKL